MRTSHVPLAERQRKFPIGTKIRYRPGTGVYGYEDCLEADGCLLGEVIGHTATRVRITISLAQRGRGLTIAKAVDYESLRLENVKLAL